VTDHISHGYAAVAAQRDGEPSHDTFWLVPLARSAQLLRCHMQVNDNALIADTISIGGGAPR
jgi:hypothetical protein